MDTQSTTQDKPQRAKRTAKGLPITQTPAWDIYVCLKDFVTARKCIPTMHGFWQFVYIQPSQYETDKATGEKKNVGGYGRDMVYSTYRYWWKELKSAPEQLVQQDRQTGAIIVKDVDIIMRKHPALADALTEKDITTLTAEMFSMLVKLSGESGVRVSLDIDEISVLYNATKQAVVDDLIEALQAGENYEGAVEIAEQKAIDRDFEKRGAAI